MKIYEIDEGFKDSFKKLNKGTKGFRDSFKTGFKKSSEVGAVVDPFKKGWKDAEEKNKDGAGIMGKPNPANKMSTTKSSPSLNTIKSSISKLNPKQQAALRKQLAKKAGVQ